MMTGSRSRTAADVIDSSAWLEYLANGPNAGEFASAIEAVDRLVVPALVITEVLRRLDSLGRGGTVPEVLAHMRRGGSSCLTINSPWMRRSSGGGIGSHS